MQCCFSMLGSATIRNATSQDAPELERLFTERGPRFGSVQFAGVRGTRHLLVLDAPDGGLAAAAMLIIDGGRGHLAMLAIAKRFEDDGLADRMIGVVEAVCTAYGAHTLDVPAMRAA